MIIALSAKHKLTLIDENYLNTGSTSPLLILWERNNTMVLSLLLNSWTENIRNSVLYCETARELWKDLEERF